MSRDSTEEKMASAKENEHLTDDAGLSTESRTDAVADMNCKSQPDDRQSAPRVSIAICTYNRAHDALEAIQSVLSQDVSPDAYEVIVVDNNSTDESPEILQALARESCSVRYAREERQGLSIARNTAWRLAKAPYVAYLDDDARAKPDWLSKVLETIESGAVNLDAFGGPIYPFYNSPKPTWFKDEWEIRSWGPDARYLDRHETLAGSNMIISRSVFKELGGFDETLSVTGTKLRLGGETEFFMRLHAARRVPCIYYRPDMIVTHGVPRSRMPIRYRLRRAYASGKASYGCRAWSRRELLTLLLVAPARVAVGLARAIAHVPRHSRPQTWAVEELKPVAKTLGRAIGGLADLAASGLAARTATSMDRTNDD